jgi:hypothetical protein
MTQLFSVRLIFINRQNESLEKQCDNAMMTVQKGDGDNTIVRYYYCVVAIAVSHRQHRFIALSHDRLASSHFRTVAIAT